MNKTLIILGLLVALTAPAQITNVNIGASPGDMSGDTIRVGFIKVNSNFVFVESQIASNLSAAMPTNVVQSSQRLLCYQTNYAFWGASNFLARVNGLYKWSVMGGDDGGGSDMIPPSAIPISLAASFSGTGNWFTLTNGFLTTNYISVAAISGVTNWRGGHLVDPGNARLYTVDRFDLLARTNYLFGQHLRFDAPVDGNDAATKNYADTLFFNALNNNWSSSVDVSNVTHFAYKNQNTSVFEMLVQPFTVPIISLTPGGCWCYTNSGDAQIICQPTNVVLQVYQTNLLAGWALQSSTNLETIAGFSDFTNYVAATNAGIVSFTIGVDTNLSMQFFRIRHTVTAAAVLNAPIVINGSLTVAGALSATIASTNLTGIVAPSNLPSSLLTNAYLFQPASAVLTNLAQMNGDILTNTTGSMNTNLTLMAATFSTNGQTAGFTNCVYYITNATPHSCQLSFLYTGTGNAIGAAFGTLTYGTTFPLSPNPIVVPGDTNMASVYKWCASKQTTSNCLINCGMVPTAGRAYLLTVQVVY